MSSSNINTTVQIYSQSSQTSLTDCFTLTGLSEGNI